MSNGTKRGNLAILVGGGPAPGINGVISAATIEGVNQGFGVIGVRDGYKWLAQGDTTHCIALDIDDVTGIHLRDSWDFAHQPDQIGCHHAKCG